MNAHAASQPETDLSVPVSCLANFHRVFTRQTNRSPGRWRQEAGAAVPVHPIA